ncbi:MAG: hypothetical protein RL338_1028 [Chloroflexota bacterium]|jgi:phosphoglycolate phosphatase-like HAD superfamily hydrolase
MWAGWVVGLAGGLEAALGRPLRDELYLALGFDAAAGHAIAGGPLAATPMAEIRELTRRCVRGLPGVDDAAADAAVAGAWTAPDPVASAAPLTDLPALLGGLRRRGIGVAVATSDDRAPTLATLEALGIAALVEGIVCADDGLPVKPRPDAVHALCARLGVPPARAAVIGDSPADLGMARAARVGLSIGVLSGVGSADDLGPLADLLLPSVAALES